MVHRPEYKNLELECGAVPSAFCAVSKSPIYNKGEFEYECIAGLSKSCAAPIKKSSVSAALLDRAVFAAAASAELSTIDADQWDICISGSSSRFRNSLNAVQVIGKGTFGDVYLATLKSGRTIVVKEAYLKPAEKLRLIEHVPRKAGAIIPRNSYPEEYSLIDLTQTLLADGSSPNFLYMFRLAVCDTCQIKDTTGACYLMMMEKANGDLKTLYGYEENDALFVSLLFQLLMAIECIHSRFGIFHRDIKILNVLFKLIPKGGHFMYVDRDDTTYFVENMGILILLADFGASYSVQPEFSGLNKKFGSRHAKLVDGRFVPFTTEPAADPLFWDRNRIVSTKNYFSAEKPTRPSIPVDLNDTVAFPAFEFFHDIQDVIRMFVGGKRSVQPGQHRDFQDSLTSATAAIIRRVGLIDRFPGRTDAVKYIVARYMMRALYEQLGGSRTTTIVTDIVGTYRS